MKNGPDLPEVERADLADRGMKALIQALGMVDAIRFIQLYRPGRGDYTRDRDALLDGLTMPAALRLMGQPELAEQVERDEAARVAAEGERVERPAA